VVRDLAPVSAPPHPGVPVFVAPPVHGGPCDPSHGSPPVEQIHGISFMKIIRYSGLFENLA
jgi:hypothetical protein